MGMWRSLHPFKLSDTSAQSKRGRSASRRSKARASADLRKALNRRALLERFEERAMLSGGPELISILANSGDVVYSPSTAGQPPVLHTSPHELDLLFNQGTVIDPSTLGGVQVVGAGADGALNTTDDVTIQPGYIGIGGTPNEIVLRFAQTLPDGLYAIDLLGQGPTALADTNSPPDLFNSGNPAQANLQVEFRVSAAPQVLSVVPEPVHFDATSNQIVQANNEIDVYFDKAIQPLPQAVNQLDPAMFQLIYTSGTATTNDDVTFNPSSVSFDASTNKATLLFSQPLESLAGNSGGAFRLRIGNDQAVSGDLVSTTSTVHVTAEPGSTFGDTQQPSLAPYSAGTLDGGPAAEHQIIDSSLGANNVSPGLAYPGGNYGPGVQVTPQERPIDFSESPLAAPPTPGTVQVFTYNFPSIYGSTTGNPSLQNVITTEQENLAREIFQLWSANLGVQFQEVSNESLGAADFGIVTGVVQAVNPTAPSSLQAIAGPAPTSPLTGLNGKPEYLAIMNSQVYSTESLYGGPWFTAAMQQIGRLMGLGFNTQDPAGTVMGAGGADPATGASPEPVYPTNADVLHGQYLYRPQSDNVDMYQFTVNSSGAFNAETIAQRATFNAITIPGTLTGTVGTAVVDGSTFTVTAPDSSGIQHSYTFEFAANGRTLTAGDNNVAINYSSTDTSQTVADDVARAVNAVAISNGLSMVATVYGSQVDLVGARTVTASANQGQVTYAQQPSGLNTVLTLYGQTNVIQVPSSGAAGAVDGSTFTLNDGVHPPVTFEFAQNGRALSDGNTPIDYLSSDNAHTVAVDIANAVASAVKTTGLNASATVQFNQVVLNGPLTVTESGNQGGVTYTVSRQIISRNDDYFGSDSFVNLHLTPGVYYVAVTSTGNTQFDPNVAGSGAGGTTQGPYDLKLDFTPDSQRNLTDLNGTPLQGDSNGTSGGAYDFWFNVSPAAQASVSSEIFVDKTPPASVTGVRLQDGSLAPIYTNIAQALQVAADRIIAPTGGTANLDGQTFVVNDGFDPPVTFEFAANGRTLPAGDFNVPVNFNTADSASTLAQEIANAIVSSPTPLQVTAVANGNIVDVVSKANPATPLAGSSVDTKGAPALLSAVKLVRILGTDGPDNSIGIPAASASGASLTAGQIITPGQSFTITAGTVTSTFEFFNGDAIEVSAASGASIADGGTFSISQGNQTVTFEFAANGRTVVDGNSPIGYQSTDSKAQLAGEIARAINAAAAAGKFGSNSPVSASYSGIGPDQNAVISVGSDASTSYSVAVSGLALKSSPATRMSISPGAVAVHYAASDTAATLAQEAAAAINASPSAQPAGGAVAASVSSNAVAYANGDAWYVNLTGVGAMTINAQSASQTTNSNGQTVSLGLLAVSNAQPYEIGNSQFGGSLADGATMNVPQGVTVMIDSGAVFKLEGANINVGLSSPSIDRSDSALQVLGTPTSSVFFTSFHDNSVGSVTDTVTAPSPGDWGGIVFGPNADLERQGIFLDSVNHARLTYGGGSVVVDGIQGAYTPIYLAGSRPAITNNTILLSKDAALSADPNSFAETVFGSPANIPGSLPPPVQAAAASSSAGGTLATGTYYYVVTALGPSGETTASGETSIAVTGPPAEVTVNWYAVAGATGYKIYRGTSSGAENVVVGVVTGGSTTSFVDTGSVVATGQSPPVSQAFTSDYERAGPDISGNTVALNQPGAQILNAAPASQIVPGETFVITTPGAGAGGTTPNVGVNSVFEFVNSLANPTLTPGELLPDGNYAVLVFPGKPAVGTTPAMPGDTVQQVALDILSAIQGANIGVTASVAANTSQVSISGAASVTPSTPTSFTAPSGAQLADGETFVVTNLATGVQTTFEFDNNGQVAAGHIAVAYTTRDSAGTVASEMAAAINGASIGVSAVTAGAAVAPATNGSQILLTAATHFVFSQGALVKNAATLTAVTGKALADDSTLQIFNSTTGSKTTFIYQLNTDTTPIPSGDIAIIYSITDTAATVASETAAAINAAGLGVSAVVSGSAVSLIEQATGEFASPLSVQSPTLGNTINGLFVRTQDTTTQAPQTLSVAARWTATDIPYVLSGNLTVQGNPGGQLDNTPRLSGRLEIDPGATVKLANARIETQMGANLIAEGTAAEPIVFTSLHDDTYGGGGTFATDGLSGNTSAPLDLPAPGNWAGLYFAPTSHGSLDHTLIAYGGGTSTVQGNSDAFDAVEIHQATVRIADSTIEYNAKGLATASRGDLLGNDAAAIYVLGAQPTIVNNVFQNNQGATISIDANSMTSAIVPDPGRGTGPIDRFTQFDNNAGPLVRLNEIGNTLGHIAINGMLVRAGTLDTASVWDDTDIVHVVEGPIAVPNIDGKGGLMLESSSSQSLVVKLSGDNAGFTATGTPLDITNRVGGSVQILGTPSHPVVLTALTDSTAGAGLTPDGRPQYDTNNTGIGGNVSSGIPTFPPSGKQLAVTTTVNATALVNAMLLRPLAAGVTITSSSLVSANPIQQGTFANGDGVPLEIPQKGTILTTGNAQIPDQNTSPDWTGAWGGPGDPRLSALIGGTATFDANELTVNFTVDPSSGIKSGAFEFQFGSEEYPLFVGSQFNDVLAGFINGDQSTNFIHDSKGKLVSINSAFFNIDNSVNPTTGKSPYNIEYNGLTSGLVASFPVKPGANTLTIAIADASDDLYDSGVLMTDLHFSTLDVGAGGVTSSGAAAGAWKGVTLDQYSNDTNVATVNESEPAYTGGVGTNDTPSTAQPLGQLAPNALAGDDTHRLGFTVNGTISPNFTGDVDTYTFQAQPGTQVWLNVGNTSPGLDSVVELVSANGTVLARSDNALAEANNPTLLQQELPGNLAQPLADGTLLGGNYDPQDPTLNNTTYDPASLQYASLRNQFSSSPLDPGFRVTLPGTPSGATPSNYYVRIYSKNTNGSGLSQYVPGKGTSSGEYQLQIRLQETQQYAGSTVQYADIRYATNGVTVQGLPTDSPLLGDAGQQPTPTTTDATAATQPSPLATAQDLGNLLSTNQGAVNVAGNVGGPTQVTWYKFELGYNLLQAIQGLNAGNKSWSTIFDVNYADGLSRPNTSISVFDSTGTLIFVGRGSNVADDQASNSPSPASNLSFGSYGQLDPYIGAAQMPAGAGAGGALTYYVAISSDAALPQALNATYNAGSANGLVRLEPLDSVNRIVEDHVGSQGGETAQPASSLTPMFNGTVDTTAANMDPTKPILATAPQAQQIASLNTSAVPLKLGDVVLFVDQGENFTTNTPGHLETVNPFTGKQVTDIGPTPGTGGGYDDIAMRNDGQLYSLTIGPPATSPAGPPTDANSGRYDLIDTGTAVATPVGSDKIGTQDATGKANSQNVGVQIHAMAYLQTGTTRELFVVGSYVGGPAPGFLNGLYQLDPNTGAVIGPVNAGAGTSPLPKLLNPAGVSSSTPEQITGMAVVNGILYAVTNAGGLYVINNPTGAASVQFVGKITDTNGNAVQFSALTNGPPDVSNGGVPNAYANDLFGTALDVNGNSSLWAFNTSAQLQAIFSGNQSSVPLGVTNVVGLAFSTLDYNLWHVTDARATDAGHGINAAPDQSRNPLSNPANQPQAGNLSYYFGLEDPNAPGVIDTAQATGATGTTTTFQPGAANYATNAANVYGTYNLPGGALGSLETNTFNLGNYNAGDAPTLYFNYFLNSGQATTGFKSSARVLISTDGGKTWGDELATNDPVRAAYNAAKDPKSGSLASRQITQASELPSFDSASALAPVTTLGSQPAVDPRQQVQQLFDGSGGWRQARIDLSNYAGQSNLMLRFDFSSAGSMNQGLPGDNPNTTLNPFNNPARGQNNKFEGFYVDDLTVGFASRGEMVTSSAANTQFFATPQSTAANAPTQYLTGPYQLDIRSGTPYAVTADPNQPDIQLVHSYDVNDRLSNAFTLVAPAGGALQDGQSFQVNDGVNVVTFEFDNLNSPATVGVAPGNIAIDYNGTPINDANPQPIDTAAQIAQKIAAAVNANTTLKGVHATVTAGDRVDFFGPVNVSSPNAVSGSLTVAIADQTLTETTPTTGATTSVTISRTNLSPAALGGAVTVQLQAIDVVGGGASQNVTMFDPATNSTSQGGLLTVLIPAGAPSTTITVTAQLPLDPGGPPELADGPQKVAIVATANGYGSTSNTLDVVDDAGVVPTLTVAITNPTSHTIVENAGPNAATGLVTRNSPDNVALVVTLTSLDQASATVPATVTIPMGAYSASFPINAVDDNVLRQQPVNVTIVASAANFAGGSATLAVRDDGDATQVPLGTPVWTAQGPAPISGGLESNITEPSPTGTGTLPNPVSGGVETLLVDPADATGNTLFAGTVNGGIWETINALSPNGPTWTPLTDNLPSLSIGALQFDLTDTTFSKMIGGIGRFSSLSAVGSNSPAGGNLVGLLQSADGGQTWSVVVPATTSPATPVGQNISGVAERGNVIMAAANASLGGSGGLLRSTDGGANFTLVSSLANSGLPAGPVTDLVADPIDLNRFYVAVLGATGGIYTTDNAGATWSDVTPAGFRATLNASPLGDTIRIADSGKAVDFAYEKFNSANNQTTLAAVFQSPVANLSSSTWVAMDLPVTTDNGILVGLNTVGGGYLSIAADPTNPTVVYLGGDQQPVPNNEGAVGATGRLFRGDSSRPTGSQWTFITDDNANGTAPPADSRSLAFDGAQLLETDDGGVYALSNPSTTGVGASGSWTSLVGNLDVTEIHNVAYDTNTHTLLAGAVADAGTSEQTAANSSVWADFSQGDGGDVAVDDSAVGTTGQSIRYTSSAHMANFEATTYDSQGNVLSIVSPSLLVGGIGGIPLPQVDTSLPRVATFVLNSQTGTPGWMVIGGENAIYESFDGGQTLKSLGGGGAGPGALFGASMAYGGISGGITNPYVLWAGVGNKVLLRTTQIGALAATNYSGGAVQSLAINPTNWRNVFIVDSSGHVWETVNGGATFQDLTGNLTGAAGLTGNDLHSVAFVPGNATNNLIYVGARDGVYQMQTSKPGVWTRYGASLPEVPVYSLEYVASQQLLVAGTLGRGAFTASAIGAAGDIMVSVDPASLTVADDGGQITGTVTRSGTFGNLTVLLNSSDPALVPPKPVTILDGQTSATFTISVTDVMGAAGDELAFARETVILTPQAGGLNPVSAFVNVTDNATSQAPSDDQPTLTVNLAANVMDPNAGVTTVAGTVTRNSPTDQDLTVYLMSSDTTRATVPATVIIPAGQTSATFTVTNLDQFANDGAPHTVTIVAAAQTYQGLEVTSANGDGSDDESPLNDQDSLPDESFTLTVLPTQHILAYNRQGDSNVVPPQGQVVIQDNRISSSLNFGILVEAAPRTAGGNPYPGVPINLTTINADRVAPGATITNNLLVDNSQGGISLSGDANSGNVAAAAVPIARVLNNTIYGGATPSGVGVQVSQNASPTILNNIFANLATGVSVDNTSSSTVLEGSIYQNDGTNLTGTVFNGGDLFSNALAPSDPLFTNAAANDFYLAAGSKAIDSGINQVPERTDLTAAKSLTGIAPSPTNAPAYDLYGQLRTADPESNPNGVGSTLYIDRGAIERVDFTGPTSALINPLDNGSADQDPTLNVVHEVGGALANFAIQLKDTNGAGVDDSTVSSSQFDLYRNGALLTAGIDYFFQYDTNTKTVYFVPATGTWATGNQYTIFVNNGVKFDPNLAASTFGAGIKDLAGNLLQANSSTGYTRYDILLQGATGDAPTIGVPPLQTVPENGVVASSLTFSSNSTPPNAITIFDIDAPNDTVTVTLQTTQGTLFLFLAPNQTGITNLTGNGTGTLSFTGTVPNVNAALNGTPAQNGQQAVSGLTFTPALDFRSPPTATIQVTAFDPLLGASGLQGSGQLSINVTPVNQPPVVNVPPVQSVLENAQQPLVLSAANGNAVTVTDPDGGTGSETVTINTIDTNGVTTGVFALGQTTNLSFGEGNGTSAAPAMIFSGTLADINAALNGMQFFPANNFTGQAVINISVNDNGNTPGPAMTSKTGTVLINVAQVNQPPYVITPIPTVTVNETSQTGVTTTINLSQYIGDPDESNTPPEAPPSLVVFGNSDPTLVTATINGQILTLTYAPYQHGAATITILATDSNSGSVHPTLQTSFTVVVNPISFPPTTANDEYVYTPGAPLVVTAPGVLANDVDHDNNALKAVLTQVPAHGRLALQNDGSFTYTPDAGFDGRDSFIYVADDGKGNRVPATVYLDTPNSRWVARMYTEVLGRGSAPGDSEVNYWVSQLDAGASRLQVSNNFVTSAERRSQTIAALYEQYLGRAVDPSGLNYWLSVWAANNGPEQVQAGIIGSNEYFVTAGGTPQAWVTKLYLNLLNRLPDSNGIAYWTNYIQSHSKQSVVLGFVTSDEYRLNLLQGTPGDPTRPGWYEQFLHRPIDSSGAQYWVRQMDSGYPQEAILEGILASPEYYFRA